VVIDPALFLSFRMLPSRAPANRVALCYPAADGDAEGGTADAFPSSDFLGGGRAGWVHIK